ncbi:MAG: PRC and DUF2382 domain-containing protein [Mycobacteriales bacterium]
MITTTQADTLPGMTLVGSNGDKIGRIDTVYTADDTGAPAFVTVHTGLFGAHTSFVPLEQATVSGGAVTVPYDKEKVKGAPHAEPGEPLPVEQEQELFAWYGVGGATSGQGTTQAAEAGAGDTSGPTTDDAMTRSEQHLVVGTTTQEAGRARLRKHVTTETESRTVPVAHDEVRVTREPITDANVGRAMDGPEISEEEHEVVLTEERPVVGTETVPVERVRLETERVVDEQTVTGEVAKEQIDTDGTYPEEPSLRERADVQR